MSSPDSFKKPRKIKPDGADGHRGRMFDKFLAAGDNDVLPRDIIEMLLYFSIRVRDTRDTAVHLMQHFDNGIDKMLCASQQELTSVDGIGVGSATLLNIVGSIVNRLTSAPNDTRKAYKNITEISELFDEFSYGLRSEITCVACFDSDMRCIAAEKLKDGAIGVGCDDIYSLVRFVTEHHSSCAAVARITDAKIAYPTTGDFAAVSFIEQTFESAQMMLAEYFVISKDEAIQVKKYVN